MWSGVILIFINKYFLFFIFNFSIFCYKAFPCGDKLRWARIFSSLCSSPVSIEKIKPLLSHGEIDKQVRFIESKRNEEKYQVISNEKFITKDGEPGISITIKNQAVDMAPLHEWEPICSDMASLHKWKPIWDKKYKVPCSVLGARKKKYPPNTYITQTLIRSTGKNKTLADVNGNGKNLAKNNLGQSRVLRKPLNKINEEMYKVASHGIFITKDGEQGISITVEK